MIIIQQITKIFPKVTALDAVTLEVKQQEFFGLLGPMEQAKLRSWIYSSDISIQIVVRSPSMVVSSHRTHWRSVRKLVLSRNQFLCMMNFPHRKNLEVFGQMFDIPRKLLKTRIDEQLNAVELYERRKDKVKSFSGGMKRRLNIIASLLHDPKVLLCDEPTVGVDPQSRNAIFEFLTFLNKQGKTIIYTTHYMEEAERLCSRIGIIDHGKIIALGYNRRSVRTAQIWRDYRHYKKILQQKRIGSYLRDSGRW